MGSEMEPEDHDDVRYYDANGVEQRPDSENLHLIDGDSQQNPIIKLILAAAVTIILAGIAIAIGWGLG